MLVCNAICIMNNIMAAGLHAWKIANTDRKASSTLILHWIAMLGFAANFWVDLDHFKFTLAQKARRTSDRMLVEFARRGFVDGNANGLLVQDRDVFDMLQESISTS